MAANSLNRIKVDIAGRTYTIKTAESEAYVQELASYVDELLNRITSRNIHIGTTRAAILGCLIITDELFKIREELEKEKNNRSPRKNPPAKKTD